LIVLAIMAVACAIADAILEQRGYPEGAPWLYADDQTDDNPHINGLVTWAFALITSVLHWILTLLYTDRVQLLIQVPKHCSYIPVHLGRIRANLSGRVYLFRQEYMV
jgi:hypothetical protein